jgi:selenocysteine-specific elongation factor
MWFSASAVGEATAELMAALAAHHSKHPIFAYAPLNAIVGAGARPEEREVYRLALESLTRSGSVIVTGDRIRLATHQPQWHGKLASVRDTVLNTIRRSGLAAPSPRELCAECGADEEVCQEVLDALVDASDLATIAAGIYVAPEALADARERVIAYLKQHPSMSIGDARDLLGASRKYLLPFLERLDSEGVTMRQGDYRVLAKPTRAGSQ